MGKGLGIRRVVGGLTGALLIGGAASAAATGSAGARTTSPRSVVASRHFVSAASTVARWTRARIVASSSRYIFEGPAIAVNRSGGAVLAWATTDKRPVVRFGGSRPGARSGSGRVPGGSVVAVLGGARSAFSRPVTVVRYRGDGPSGVVAAVSRTGAAFVTWTRGDSSRRLIARVGRRGASRPRSLLPRYGQLYELSSGLDGSILVSWEVRHDRGVTLYDAPLRASGRLGRVRRLVFVPPSARQMELAFNDRGGAVVAWLKAVPSGRYIPSPVKVIVCPPVGRCGPTRTTRLGPGGAYDNNFVAAALTDDGTAAVASDVQIDSNTGPGPADAGVWAAVSHKGGPLAPQQKISATGNGPALAAVATDGLVLSYTPPRPSPAGDWDAPAIATLAPGASQFLPAGQYPGTATGDVPALQSGGGSSAFGVYWGTPVGHKDAARIAIGGPGGIGTVHKLSANVFPSIALDHLGDALVAWSHPHEVKLEVETASAAGSSSTRQSG